MARVPGPGATLLRAGGRRSSLVPPFPVRVELVEEVLAPGRLLRLADPGGGGAQGVERSEEPAVARLRPAHPAGPPPPVGPELVESAVVADPGVGVRLDRVGRDLGEEGPGVD